MRIVNCGYNYRHPGDFSICRPDGTGDCIFLVVRSSAYFLFEGKRQLTEGNAVVLLRKGTPQLYGGVGKEFVNDWVHFEANDEDIKWINSLGLQFDTILELSNVLPLSSFIQQIFTEMYSENRNAGDSADLLFRLLILKASDLGQRAKDACSPYMLEKLLKLKTDIFSEPQSEKRVEEMAKELSLSCSYLQHLYKKHFQRSIKEDITASKLEYAKYLLFSTDDTVSAISALCGYQNDVHFMRLFKQKIGMTPTEYRISQSFSKDKTEKAKKRAPYSL